MATTNIDMNSVSSVLYNGNTVGEVYLCNTSTTCCDKIWPLSKLDFYIHTCISCICSLNRCICCSLCTDVGGNYASADITDVCSYGYIAHVYSSYDADTYEVTTEVRLTCNNCFNKSFKYEVTDYCNTTNCSVSLCFHAYECIINHTCIPVSIAGNRVYSVGIITCTDKSFNITGNTNTSFSNTNKTCRACSSCNVNLTVCSLTSNPLRIAGYCQAVANGNAKVCACYNIGSCVTLNVGSSSITLANDCCYHIYRDNSGCICYEVV